MRSKLLALLMLGSTACATTRGVDPPAPVAVPVATAPLDAPACLRSFEDVNDPTCPVQGMLSEEERSSLGALADDALPDAGTPDAATADEL
jgi:hypothetical protein